MTVAYLDVDDEITGAVGRLRGSNDLRIALVLPPGSRIATSRINFRLLAREARGGGRLLAIVTPEPSVRAIAVSAGLPAYATVPEYEAAIADGATEVPAETTAPPGIPRRAPDRSPTTAMAGALATGGATSGAVTTDVAAAESAAGPEGLAGHGRREKARNLPVVGGRGDDLHLGRWLAVLVVLAIVAGLAGFGAYLYLPSATITITPVGQAIGPVSLTATADPAATAVDASTGTVPADAVEIPLKASDTFNATGVKVSEKKAAGTVTFTSFNTATSVDIPAGTIVSTSRGVSFATTKTVNVPKADFVGSKAGVADAPIVASEPGTAGNVAAGTITRMPSALQAQLINPDQPVYNQKATSGGTHTETTIVAKADYDNAVKALTARIHDQLTAALADPSTAPEGQTLFPETAQLGDVKADTAAATLVGKALDTFDLSASGTAHATAVDQKQLAPLAVERLMNQVPAGYRLFEDSITSQVGKGTVDGDAVHFPVQASAEIWKPIDGDALLKAVQGKSIDQARTYLARFGVVTIETWPDWTTAVPTIEGRASLTVEPPRRGSGAPPTPAPSP